MPIKTDMLRYAIRVDADTSLETMVQAGKYQDIDRRIREDCFPVECRRLACKTEVLIVRFLEWPGKQGWAIGAYEPASFLHELGLSTPPLDHLLALGSAYPNLQEECTVICLGSAIFDEDRDPLHPALGVWEGKRRLYLSVGGHPWNSASHFLASEVQIS